MTELNRESGVHLIVCGGPSCVGKTTLIERIKRNQLPEIREQLGISALSEWHFESLLGFSRTFCQTGTPDFLFLHVDLYSQIQGVPGLSFLQEVIVRYQQVTALELFARHQELSSHLKKRRAERSPLTPTGILKQIFRWKKTLKFYRNFNQKMRFYRNPSNIDELHNIWRVFWNSYQGVTHYQIECNTSELHLTPRQIQFTEASESYQELILKLIDSPEFAQRKFAA